MSAIKFNHVFAALLFISALSAFVIPTRYTAKAQPQVQSLLYPVARPVSAVVGWMHDKVARPALKDSRDLRTLLEENEALQQELMAKTDALNELRRWIAEWRPLGPLLKSCTAVSAVGSDAGARESLQLRASSFEGLRQGQFVLFPRGVVGYIERPPGALGAQVRLITDLGVRIEASFRALKKDESGRPVFEVLDTPVVLVEGIGDGAMRCTFLTMEHVQKAGITVGTWAVVQDRDWDERLHGRALGRVVRVEPQRAAPLYADIRIEPVTSLVRLTDVMVLTK